MMASLGGGKLFAKKKAKPATADAPFSPVDNNQSNVYVFSPGSEAEEPRGRVSMFKRISYALPGNASKRAGKQRSRSMNPAQRTRPSPSWEQDLPAAPRPPFAVPQYSTGSESDVLDIARGPSSVNLHRLTPRSSDGSDSFERHLHSISTRSILPFASTNTIPFSDRTAVQDTPSVPFPSGSQRGTFDQMAPASSLPRRQLTRARSFSDSSRLLGVHFAPPRPQSARPEQSSPLLTSAKKPRPLSAVMTPSVDQYKRRRRITLDASMYTAPRSSFTHPYSKSIDGKLHDQEPLSPTSTHVNPNTIASLEDPFSNLFTSCAISLFLLIILAAGKDVLYVIALLPVLMALARHFTDFDKIIAVGPLMKKNLENLISL
ncbi:hypothetical protein FS842_009665 [Serendipita sp. 407]|nr:hypothetical protein FS842_009665 [Serendipita sp. 407]